jgi:hypothetical protein
MSGCRNRQDLTFQYPCSLRVPLAKRGEPKGGGQLSTLPLQLDNTNRRAKVCKCVGFESPLTPTLSPLIKGGEGREWGDSARAAICELCPRDWYNNPTLDRCALTPNRSARGASLNSRVAHLILNPREIAPNSPPNRAFPPLTSAQKCAILWMSSGQIQNDPLTNPTKVGYNRGHDGECNSPSAMRRRD